MGALDPEDDLAYWHAIRERAAAEGFDGCTGVTNAHRDCCLEHDYGYRHHSSLDGTPLTKAQVDKRFLDCMKRRSKLGAFSPLAWWRYLAVRVLNRKSW